VIIIKENLYYYKAFVEEVTDGDTINVLIDLGFDVKKKETIRLYGIDTPETRGASDLEEKAANKVKLHLKELIEGEEILISTKKLKEGSFGRYIAEIFFNNQSINKYLIKNCYARDYFKSASKTDWDKNKIKDIIEEL
jgi:micrococcal nuclease